MATPSSTRQNRIRQSAEALFGGRVVEVSAPGGSSRSSLRFHFDDHTVIGTLRPNYRRTHLEAFVLRALEPYCDDIPRVLGVDREVLFQTDVGARRLNIELHKADPERRLTLLADSVAAIFRIQAAARHTNLHQKLPHMGNNPDWLSNLVDGADALTGFAGDLPASYDRTAVIARLHHPGTQFVKWDCRSGNAAIGSDGRLRWFDFEYAGLRHGAEDLAWLIGDESLPIAPAVLQAVIEDALPADVPGGRADYLDYLAVYTVFHALQRLILIMREARSRGWLTVRRVLDRDDVGVHPEMARNLCRMAGHFASLSPLTEMLAEPLETTAKTFDRILKTGRA
ncbi:MAG: hypothetical protein H6898_16675 [Rhodobacter sp.]|nr:hypothetical protein [Paracoccaceae bacterium]MCC0078192.1 hypothetical protein [Rhodobacter sp.]